MYSEIIVTGFHAFIVQKSISCTMNSDGYVSPRLIITDVRMGKMDGFELIKTVLANGSKAKLIVMSGFYVHNKYAEQNFDYILAKPFDVQLLESTVSQLLSNSIHKEASASAYTIDKSTK